MRPSFVTSLALIGVALALVPGTAGAQVVHTATGNVQGVHDGVADEWRGVPYARPPVGALRWRPPRPAQAWTGTRGATQFATECAQPAFNEQGQVTGADGSEDCLYLNVFVPAGASPSSRLPVMVHLHPGANSVGAPYQDADAFVRRGVIVVTMAYRLGMFGFVAHPALSAENGGTSGEYGLLDQIAALRWVHDNIAAFGGDPQRVTVFGQSSGAISISALTASPLTEGLFQRAIGESGGLFEPLELLPELALPGAEQQGQRFAAHAGAATIEALRALPADQLEQVSFGPALILDGYALPQDPYGVYRAGRQ